jgi:hypothetical protein
MHTAKLGVDFGFERKIMGFFPPIDLRARSSVDGYSNLGKLSVFCIIVRQLDTRCWAMHFCKEGETCNHRRAWHFPKNFHRQKPEFMPKLADPADLSAWAVNDANTAKYFIFRLWTRTPRKIFSHLHAYSELITPFT